MIKVIVIDDEPIVIKELEYYLSESDNIEIVATATNKNEAIEKCIKIKSDIIICDMMMQESRFDGIDIIKTVLKKNKAANFVMFTSLNNRMSVYKAIKSGAVDFIPKRRIKDIVREITNIFEDLEMWDTTLEDIQNSKDRTELTEMEKKVLDCKMQGLTDKEIARFFCIEYKTVRSHVNQIIRKLSDRPWSKKKA